MLVTIFGGGGFLGRYIAQELLTRGMRVRVAERDPGDAMRVKPLGGLGQTQLVYADVRDRASVERAVAGADAVVNLVAVLKGDFEGIVHEGGANVAQAATAAGVKALVHVSAIGADPASTSAYGRAKGGAEEAVRAAFPKATILRPSVIFGREDQFTNRFANLIRLLRFIPVISGKTKFQPIYVVDVARAVAISVADPVAHGGKLYELGGPEVMTMTEINMRIAKAIGHDRATMPIPDFLAAGLARFTGWLPCAPITFDQWKMLQQDNIVAKKARGLADLDVAPTPLAAVADSWLVQYRRHGRFTDSVKA